MDEEELQKRFTDCVYFLASPLTCKKGIECEYRHSEIARLNPRDCWYWLGGCCFNPDCAFRHPPLEGLKEAYRESSNPNNVHPALPVDKTNIPCYFYSKGFCNKGERCSFLHGPADVSVAWKSSKLVPSEKKLSAGSNTGSPPVESRSNLCETAQIEHTHTESKPTQVVSESPDVSDSLVLRQEFVQSESDNFNDQISNQQVDDYVEQEGWLESPPGFDVLVEGESERLGYEGSDLDLDYAEFDCADPAEYDPAYPDVYDVGKISGQSRESIFYRLSFQKPNLQLEPIFNSRRGSDLGERLKKRRVYDSLNLGDHRISRNPRRHGLRGEVKIDYKGRLRRAIPMNRNKRPGKRDLREKRKSREESVIFTGPKTLDQIKEEKKKGLQNRDLTESDGFHGPRPLSEILKNKRKLG